MENEFDKSEDIKLIRSKQATELINSNPGFLVRWGITILLLLALLLSGTTWFIRYPDIVNATARLNSINAPKEIVTNMQGKLTRLFVKSGDAVKKNQVIGFIESTGSHQQVIDLEAELDSLAFSVNRQPAVAVSNYFIRASVHNALGDLQPAFQTYIQAQQSFSNYLTNGFFETKMAMLYKDIIFLQRLRKELLGQKELLEQDIKLSDTTFMANEKLLQQKVISSMDYRNEKSKLLSKKMSIPQINNAVIANENQEHEKNKEILELQNQIQQQQVLFIQALNTLKNQLIEWKRQYLLISPEDGTITLAGFFQENQTVNASQLICYVNPGASGYYTEAIIPQYNFGKVDTGQEVMLRFAAYPSEEYGTVKGKVVHINNIPGDSGFLATISLPEGLVTNHNRKIAYRNGLTATASIITEDLRLSQRLLNTLRKNIQR